MKTNYKQVIDDILNISGAHKQVNDTGYGDIWEINKQQLSKPVVWLSDGKHKLNGGRVTLNFFLYVLDQTLHDESNEKEVLSDCMLIGLDIVGKIGYNDDTHIYDYYLDTDDVPITIFTNFDKGNDAGVRFEIDIIIDESLDSCSAPFNEIP